MIGIWGMYGNESILENLKSLTDLRTGEGSGSLESLSKICDSTAVFNLALIPRISRAQSLDVLTSMANIAGYRAVLDAFAHFPKFAKPSTTASGNTPPAKVFIVGAGVAGLSAIGTAHALGAKVFASDVRSAAKEQVESMGAVFVEVKGMIQGEGAGGYAKEMDEDFKRRQSELYARMCRECDIVITTALIPNRPAPIVITEQMVSSMKRGSVIVDLAALNGGNCPATVKDEVVITSNGVCVIGKTNYPSEMAPQASEFLARNFINFFEIIYGKDGKLPGKMKAEMLPINSSNDISNSMKTPVLNLDDQIIRDSLISLDTTIMWPPPKPKENIQPVVTSKETTTAASSPVESANTSNNPAVIINMNKDGKMSAEARETEQSRGTKGMRLVYEFCKTVEQTVGITDGFISEAFSVKSDVSNVKNLAVESNCNLTNKGYNSAGEAYIGQKGAEMIDALLDWIRENEEEIAMFLGSGVLLALGLATSIPSEELVHLGYFVLSLMIGHFTVASVTPALHTPLISVTNAISGIIVIGGMLNLGGPLVSAKVACAMLAVFFSSVNIVGGFAVTERMLAMFIK